LCVTTKFVLKRSHKKQRKLPELPEVAGETNLTAEFVEELAEPSNASGSIL